MKILRNLFALLVFTVFISSCDSTVTVDDPKTETTEEITSKTGAEENETDGREDG